MKNLLAFVFFLSATACYSQASMQPKKVENPRWKQIVYLDFQDGKYDRAITIIKDYFAKAGSKANVPGPETMLRMNSGQWDLMLIWNMKGGIDDLNWETSPDDVAWMKAMSELAGGPDKAKAILDEWSSLLRNSQTEIARVAM